MAVRIIVLFPPSCRGDVWKDFFGFPLAISFWRKGFSNGPEKEQICFLLLVLHFNSTFCSTFWQIIWFWPECHVSMSFLNWIFGGNNERVRIISGPPGLVKRCLGGGFGPFLDQKPDLFVFPCSQPKMHQTNALFGILTQGIGFGVGDLADIKRTVTAEISDWYLHLTELPNYRWNTSPQTKRLFAMFSIFSSGKPLFDD